VLERPGGPFLGKFGEKGRGRIGQCEVRSSQCPEILEYRRLGHPYISEMRAMGPRQAGRRFRSLSNSSRVLNCAFIHLTHMYFGVYCIPGPGLAKVGLWLRGIQRCAGTASE
jgi:hypothetical protein